MINRLEKENFSCYTHFSPFKVHTHTQPVKQILSRATQCTASEGSASDPASPKFAKEQEFQNLHQTPFLVLKSGRTTLQNVLTFRGNNLAAAQWCVLTFKHLLRAKSLHILKLLDTHSDAVHGRRGSDVTAGHLDSKDEVMHKTSNSLSPQVHLYYPQHIVEMCRTAHSFYLCCYF